MSFLLLERSQETVGGGLHIENNAINSHLDTRQINRRERLYQLRLGGVQDRPWYLLYHPADAASIE